MRPSVVWKHSATQNVRHRFRKIEPARQSGLPLSDPGTVEGHGLFQNSQEASQFRILLRPNCLLPLTACSWLRTRVRHRMQSGSSFHLRMLGPASI